jgi:hypothetical protein
VGELATIMERAGGDSGGRMRGSGNDNRPVVSPAAAKFGAQVNVARERWGRPDGRNGEID